MGKAGAGKNGNPHHIPLDFSDGLNGTVVAQTLRRSSPLPLLTFFSDLTRCLSSVRMRNGWQDSPRSGKEARIAAGFCVLPTAVSASAKAKYYASAAITIPAAAIVRPTA